MHLTKLTKKTASESHNLPKFLQTVFCTFPLSLLRGKCHNRATTIAPGSNWLNKQRIITHSPLKKKNRQSTTVWNHCWKRATCDFSSSDDLSLYRNIRMPWRPINRWTRGEHCFQCSATLSFGSSWFLFLSLEKQGYQVLNEKLRRTLN